MMNEARPYQAPIKFAMQQGEADVIDYVYGVLNIPADIAGIADPDDRMRADLAGAMMKIAHTKTSLLEDHALSVYGRIGFDGFEKTPPVPVDLYFRNRGREVFIEKLKSAIEVLINPASRTESDTLNYAYKALAHFRSSVLGVRYDKGLFLIAPVEVAIGHCHHYVGEPPRTAVTGGSRRSGPEPGL